VRLQVIKPQSRKLDAEQATIISLAVSFGLLLLIVGSWAMWESLGLFVERISTLALWEIP
jgi:cytochrome b subunit of formate dehydrogenase